MKKKLCALVLAVLIAISLSGCVTCLTAISVYDALVPDELQYANVVETNWGIKLPTDGNCERLYYDSEHHPRGEGLRYGVLRYEDETVLDDYREWTTEDGPGYYLDSYLDLVTEAFDALSVPEEYRLDAETCQWWYHRDGQDEIILFRSENILYVIESFF